MRGFYDFLRSRIHRKIGFDRTINSQTIRVYDEDVNGHILHATGTAAASTQNSQAGYAKGATYVKTDVAGGTSAVYQNTGTTTSSTFTLIGTLTAGSVTLTELDSAIAPSHVVKFAGQETTGGGNAAEAITVTGALATDLAFVEMVDNGTNSVTIVSAVLTLNTLTVTFSGDPAADTIINYQILRATA